MTENTAPSNSQLEEIDIEYVQGWRQAALFLTLFLTNAIAQIDRILPFILFESIKLDLSLSDTQVGLLMGIPFAVCFTLFLLPLARASDRGSPRFVLISSILVCSAMSAFGGLSATFVLLVLTRFGVASGVAGCTPSGHKLIARKINPERRGLALGIFSMGIPLGAMVAFVVGGAIGDTLGWRVALVGAGAIGGLVALLAMFFIEPTPPFKHMAANAEPLLRSSLELLSSPAFRWIFITAIGVGFATAPFYIFCAPFLIRTHGFTASEAGLVIGLLQGLMGIIGSLLGGRGLDRAVRSRTKGLLMPPAVLFSIVTVTTTAALFVPTGWMSVCLLVPGMFSFAFILPWFFGTAHLVAGKGKEAMASSLGMIGSALLGPGLGPLLVGMISDAATAAQMPNGLRFGLLICPIACFLSAIACLIANQRIATLLRPVQNTR
jgi:predicted MFS family arabinose efflux permease